ncbi:N-6 DNA methylase [Kutzneria sp. NPDC052558]|uniref:N-6 DNA methylase n=1 Tax=Kutzneria sp. NPDC052558 TaxID=3364121 RepID=UPI0037C87AC0
MTPSTNRAPDTGRAFPNNPHEHAAAIAEAVARRWHRDHGSGAIEVPISVVAALSMLSPPDDERDWTATALQSVPLDRFIEIIRAQWAIFITYRPDLVNRAWPLISVWHSGQPLPENTVTAAKAVSDAAVTAGLLSLTGTPRRRDTDVFGPLLAIFRPDVSKGVRGQIYTPPDLADAIAQLLPPAEGGTVLEPAVGTGGLLRSAAEAMRAHGGDPTTVRWCAVDIDELAVACLTVNVVLWELGHDVVLGVGDSLADDWLDRALAERRETVEIAKNITAVKAFLRLSTNGDQP